MKKVAAISVLILLITIIISCEKEDHKTFIYLGKTELSFNYDENLQNITISNIAGQDFDWNVSSADNYFYFDKPTGTLSPNAYEEINIYLNRNEVPGDSISSQITFSSSEGEPVSIDVMIYSYPENKIRIGSKISQATYSKENNKVIMSSQNEEYIEIFDVTEKTFDRIEISNNYQNGFEILEASPNGKYLIAAEHDRAFHIDLENKEILHQFVMNDQIESIVYCPGNIAYFFLNWNNEFYRFDLNSYQQEAFLPGLRNLNAKPHPSWKYLYGIGNYNDLIKIDIQGDIPEVKYSQYISSMGVTLWLPGDGNRIITSDNKILSIDPDAIDYDVTNVAEISSLFGNYITMQVAQNPQINEFYFMAVSNNYYETPYHLFVYDNNLIFDREIEPEGFYYTDQGSAYLIEPARVQFVFTDASGQNIILITRPGSNSHSYGSAIEIIPVGKNID